MLFVNPVTMPKNTSIYRNNIADDEYINQPLLVNINIIKILIFKIGAYIFLCKKIENIKLRRSSWSNCASP